MIPDKEDIILILTLPVVNGCIVVVSPNVTITPPKDTKLSVSVISTKEVRKSISLVTGVLSFETT